MQGTHSYAFVKVFNFFTAFFHFSMAIKHLSGTDNGPADSVSRNKLDTFFVQVPQANINPTSIPAELWTFLVTQQPVWISQDWRRLFLSLCSKVLQNLPGYAMNPA